MPGLGPKNTSVRATLSQEFQDYLIAQGSEARFVLGDHS